MIKATLMGIALAGVIGMGAGCASNSSMSCCSDMKSADTKPAAKALMKLDDEWSASTASHDVDKFVSYYADDAVVLPPNEPMAIGRDAAKKALAGLFSDPSFKLSFKATSASVSKDGAMGQTTGTYAMSMKGPDGKMMNENGKYLCVWQKQSDGKWKSIRDMWSSDTK